MTETGWPLIPREVLPAPVRPARVNRRAPAAAPSSDAGRQLSIFGAEATEPSPADLAGLLAGPGRLGRMGGTARVSVRVDAAWRVHVLVAELVSRGLVVSWLPARDQEPEVEVRQSHSPESTGPTPHKGSDEPDAQPESDVQPESDAKTEPDAQPAAGAQPADGAEADGPDRAEVAFEVRTAYSSRLNALARAWPAAADQLFLSGPRLRLWVAAAGRPRDGGFALALGHGDDPGKMTKAVDSALRRAGLDGEVLEDGLDYLIMGRRRLSRLAELVGERPAAAPAALWPGGPAA